MSIKINLNDDFETILICAERYALGRQTYMPKLVVDYITPRRKCIRPPYKHNRKKNFY